MWTWCSLDFGALLSGMAKQQQNLTLTHFPFLSRHAVLLQKEESDLLQ